MKKFDMHIHASGKTPDPEGLLKNMEEAGIYGGCVFSNRPDRHEARRGTSFDERLTEVLEWTKDHKDRLFPVVWVHPYEDGIMEKVHRAKEAGAMAFKIICGDFYIYEDTCLDVLTEMAKLNMPVFFHSGILWNGAVSSKYNRPLHWEALLEIKNLRFSMGHCSWPWVDECIALYGKFLNSISLGVDTAEMFFDITPGTPAIYREELLRKLFRVGYDVPDNIMFGTDASASSYNSGWTKEWLKLDGQIMEELGVTEEIKEKVYCDNLLRFLGLKEKNFTHISPVCDRFTSWYPGLEREQD